MRGDISGSDALPESRKANDGNIAWQKTGSRAQAYGDGVPGDPRDTVKVELLETQSPEGATLTPAGKTPETGAGPCGVIARGAPQSSGVQERCPVRTFKETDGTPK